MLLHCTEPAVPKVETTVSNTITHLKVPAETDGRSTCLGPDGAAADVTRTIKMIQSRWKLPVLFRLYAAASMRHAELMRDLPEVSQKMLTQHLRELEKDDLINRQDRGEKRPHVEYQLSDQGRDLLPVLIAMRDFSVRHPA